MGTTRAVIDEAALAENFRHARSRSGDCEVMAVIKADAYGHGAVDIAAALQAAGCSRFAVGTLEEGLALREAGLTAPVLLLGGVDDEAGAREATARSLTPVLHAARPRPWLGAAPGAALEDLEPQAARVEGPVREVEKINTAEQIG